MWRWMAVSWTLVAAVGAALGQAQSRPAVDETDAGVIAVFQISGTLREAPPAFDLGFAEENRPTLYELVEKLRKAGKDERVKAIVLTFDDPEIGLGQIQELREAIRALRGSDKDVYSWIEQAGMGLYLLASAAPRVFMAPVGELDLTGLHTEQTYLKGLLDKIGLEADIEHIGDYKSAGEPFTRTGPSEQALEMLGWLTNDIFEQMLEAMAESRGMARDDLRAIIDRGPFTAQEAMKEGLVDELLYPGEVVELLRRRYGKDVAFDRAYGEKQTPEIDLSSPFALFKILGEAMGKAKGRKKPSVAVVYVDGMIVEGETEDDLFGDGGTAGSTTLRRALDEAREADHVKAVVLRVDSPGGSALASDIIWNAAESLKGVKPLVVSMGNVAASGGYFVSAGAGTIYADPACMTGSIGVITGKLVTRGLWDWLGVSFHEHSIGRNADLYSTNRRFDERQRAIVRGQAEEMYRVFTSRVQAGRGERLKKDLAQLAGGRVFTGRQALELGLVDRLGGLHDAIADAAGQAGLTTWDVVLMPEPRNILEYLFAGRREKQKETPSLRQILGRGASGRPPLLEAVNALRPVDPARARAILTALRQLEMLGREGTLAVMPGALLVR